jgi:hypothetical protein
VARSPAIPAATRRLWSTLRTESLNEQELEGEVRFHV